LKQLGLAEAYPNTASIVADTIQALVRIYHKAQMSHTTELE
jgi:hypothetical protein